MAKDKKTNIDYTPYKMKGSPMKRNFPNDIGTAKPGDSPVEAWDWGSAGGGAAKGAAAGAVLGPWGAVIGGAIGGVAGGIQGGKEKELLEAQEMEEQKKNEIVAEELKKARTSKSAYNTARAERAEEEKPNNTIAQLA